MAVQCLLSSARPVRVCLVHGSSRRWCDCSSAWAVSARWRMHFGQLTRYGPKGQLASARWTRLRVARCMRFGSPSKRRTFDQLVPERVISRLVSLFRFRQVALPRAERLVRASSAVGSGGGEWRSGVC